MSGRDCNIAHYMEWLRETRGVAVQNYDELWAWSVRDIEGFWQSLAAFYGVQAQGSMQPALGSQAMPGAQWFPDAKLNYAEHIFRMSSGMRPALIAVDEAGQSCEWSWDRLRRETAAFAACLRRHGVQSGDRVVAYIPNVPEAVVAFLATASIGALWSACNQDVAVQGALSRFGQLEPKILIATDGVHYGGREHTRLTAVRELRAQLPTVQATVIVPRISAKADLTAGEIAWADAIAQDAPLEFTSLPFSHPLWVLFSSGTTGAPKGIVHGHGGILLEQLKFLGLHVDVREGDRFFWYCSTSWVMWNVLVSALLMGATIVTYDGSPMHPDAGVLWKIAGQHRASILGVSPAYLQACAKEGLRPRDYGLESLRSVGCTGAPIPLAAYDWVRQQLGDEVPLDSVSGGTDVAGGFVAGCPLVPVYPGENSVRCLGVAAEAWNDQGQPVVGEVGELVITKPMPSMPLHFWNDADGKRYRGSYFDTFPGVWRHGDWVTLAPRGSVTVHGRSDATLNRHGVRLGSAEIYQAVDALPEVQESLVIGAELPDGGYWMPLFVHLREGHALDDALRKRINDAIRNSASPRHVPDEIIAVAGIPHTLTGKRMEVPIKRILLGTPVATALNLGSVDKPELLQAFVDLARQ